MYKMLIYKILFSIGLICFVVTLLDFIYFAPEFSIYEISNALRIASYFITPIGTLFGIFIIFFAPYLIYEYFTSESHRKSLKSE